MALPPVKICVHCPSFPQLAFTLFPAGMMQQDRIIQTSQNSFLQSHSVFNLTLERSPSYCIHYKHTVKVNFVQYHPFKLFLISHPATTPNWNFSLTYKLIAMWYLLFTLRLIWWESRRVWPDIQMGNGDELMPRTHMILLKVTLAISRQKY